MIIFNSVLISVSNKYDYRFIGNNFFRFFNTRSRLGCHHSVHLLPENTPGQIRRRYRRQWSRLYHRRFLSAFFLFLSIFSLLSYYFVEYIISTQIIEITIRKGTEVGRASLFPWINTGRCLTRSGCHYENMSDCRKIRRCFQHSLQHTLCYLSFLMCFSRLHFV